MRKTNSLLISAILLSSALTIPCLVFAEETKTKEVSEKSSAEKKSNKTKKSKKTKPKLPPAKAEIESGSIYYDKGQDIVTFEENVTMKYKGKTLNAEKVVYDRTARLVTAEKGVDLIGATGNVFRAEKLVVDDELRTGELNQVNATLRDGSVIFSDSLKILNKEQYSLRDSTYSPCKPCADGKHLWSVEADRIFYDEKEGKVTYRDVYFRAYDQKIGWTPYISHPTPYAESKSGFLTPSFGSQNIFGTFVTVPYYYQPKRNLDFTFTPTYITQDGLLMQVENRYLHKAGDHIIRVSGIYTDEINQLGRKVPDGGQEFRGHIEAEGKYNISEEWTFDFDAKRATDDTYLQRYALGFQDFLTTVGSFKKIKDRQIIDVSALTFQGLRLNDDPDISPVVFPRIDYQDSFRLWDDQFNSRVDTLGNALVIRRSEGAEVARFVTGADVNGSYLTETGHIFDYSLLARFDYFQVQNNPVNGQPEDDNIFRAIPQATFGWKYPLYAGIADYGIIVEPIANVIVAPNGLNDGLIPNEDSQNIEIFDYNLFQENHISGYDLVESGTRTNYGVRTILNDTYLGDISTLFGQTYRMKEQKIFGVQSGMEDNFSDYVARVSIEGEKYFNSNYSVRLSKDNFSVRRNELDFTVRYNPVRVTNTYTFVDGLGITPDRQELINSAKYNIDGNWSLNGRSRRNLDNDDNAGWVNAGGGLMWQNECLSLAFEVNREFTRDRDIEPNTRFMFWVNLANLGG